MCCYDKKTGSLNTGSGPNSGFYHRETNMNEIISSG